MEGLKAVQENSEFVKRIVYSVLLLGSGFCAVFLAPFWIYFFVVEAFILTAFHEYIRMLERKDIRLNFPLMLTLAFLSPFAVLWDALPFFMVLVIAALFFAQLRETQITNAFRNTTTGFFGILWIAVLFSFIAKFRYEVPEGSRWVFYAIVTTKLGDAAAYLVGKKFGRTKFFAHVSPRKTWEGAVGQLVATVALSIAAMFYLDVSPGHLALLGFLVGIAAEVGDLVESMVKRGLEVKDSGTIPGLGGMLDVLDSLIFTLPLIYFYVVMFVLF